MFDWSLFFKLCLITVKSFYICHLSNTFVLILPVSFSVKCTNLNKVLS